MNNTYLLDLRSSSIGGAVVPGRIVQFNTSGEELGREDDLRLESAVTFLLHGYNVDRKRGQATLVHLAKLLKRTGVTGAIVAVLWPGDSQTLGFASYPFESKDANDAAAELARFTQRVIKKSVKLSFVSHSLGARVVMKSIQLLCKRNPIDQVCLLAAAIDDFSLAEPKNYRDAVLAARRVAVLASEQDQVLRDAYPLGDLLQSLVYADELFGQALGLRGPVPTSRYGLPGQVLHVQIPSRFEVDHDDYLPHASVSKEEKAAASFTEHVLKNDGISSYIVSDQ